MINTLHLPQGLMPGRNPIPVRVQADANYLLYDTYYLLLRVEVAPGVSGAFSDLGLEIRLYPRPDGIIEFSLNELLRPSVGIHRPDPAGAVIQAMSALGTYLLRYRFTLEDYGDGSLLDTYTSSTYYTLNAGQAYTKEELDLSLRVLEGRFLTHQPRTKQVRPWQPEYLTWQNAAIATHALQYQTFAPDGTPDPVQTATGQAVPISLYSPYLFQVGHEQLGLPSGRYKWEVWVQNTAAGVRASEKFTYEIDPVFGDQDRFYLFRNSLGGYDTLRTVGNLKQQQQISRIDAQQYTAPIYDRTLGNYALSDVRQVATYEQATGLQPTEASQAWLLELLRSEEVFRVGDHRRRYDSAPAWQPIVVEAGSTDLYADQDFTYGMTFRYREAFEGVGG